MPRTAADASPSPLPPLHRRAIAVVGIALFVQLLQRSWRRVPRPLEAARALRPAAAAPWLFRALRRILREAAGAPRCGTPGQIRIGSRAQQTAVTLWQEWESNPRLTVSKTVALPTELSCWEPRLESSCGTRGRHFTRARQAGFTEPAPLTRIPVSTSSRHRARARHRIPANR